MEKDLYPNIYFYRRLVQARLFMEKNFEQPIKLERIAAQACFSKFHFIRSFSRIYGQTPHQYLAAIRIKKAKQLLQTAMPVANACYACGFESIGSFSTRFKKTTGLTPGEYRSGQLSLRTDRQAMPLKYIPACFATKNGWT